MTFYVNPADGSPDRMAGQITFMTDAEEPTYRTVATHEGSFLYDEDHELVAVPSDVNVAARHVARLLHRCPDHSIVIDTCGHAVRGNEDRTATVYPPHKQPRIHVKG